MPVRVSDVSRAPKMPDKHACRRFGAFPEHPRRLRSMPAKVSDVSKGPKVPDKHACEDFVGFHRTKGA